MGPIPAEAWQTAGRGQGVRVVESSVSVDEELLTHATGMLARAERVAILTGAGVSAESGLATFRGADGLWEGHRVEDVATPMGFRRAPELVWRFYHMRRAALRQAAPNPAHVALAELEQRRGSERMTLITQNVDGLHPAAGSRNVLELHGSLRRVRCSQCGEVRESGIEPLDGMPVCASCGGLLRPGVVWFHEPLPMDVWWKAEQATQSCQCFLVIGTSALVYPAAGLITQARQHGASIIEVNLTETEASHAVDIGLYGPAGSVVPRLVQGAL